MAEHELKPLLDPSAFSEPKPLPPTVGFLPRAGAFCVDAFLLWFVANALVTYAYEALYPARFAWQFVVAAGVFAYFWIGSTAATGGRTVGKLLLRLRVAGLDGRPLRPGPAAVRALLVACMLLTWSFWRGIA